MDAGLRDVFIAAKDKSQYDMHAKKLLSQKSILSHILAATVDEYQGMRPEEIEKYIEGEIYVGAVPIDPGLTNMARMEDGKKIAGINPFLEESGEGWITCDIVFYVRMRDGVSKIIVNLEAQKDEPSGYDILNRSIFYVCRLVSSQKERDFEGQRYNDLVRVYSIWVCMNMKECIWNYIHLTDEAIVASHHWKGKLDLLNIVLLGLPERIPEQKEYGLHRLLGALFDNRMSLGERMEILEQEYQFESGAEFKEELEQMCNLGQGIWEKGVQQGMQQGRAWEIIGISRDEGLSDERILARLQSRLEISLDQAKEYLLGRQTA